ncbi:MULTISPECIES: adenosylcobinamide-GDP ribazoletransferase [unclassified Janthinobacterium]|uniref:adenosylcobinamide-GDP ribazoletransferase n=1 Tax=unclassified Janthinobacterium TaxID=2610881 RepID=UPI00160FE9FB|nr:MULTISPECIES: adenosylcobinamide-GDP ribazoletransferase [unclassified Janthinobacterium]MBB5370618.1 adenosylcobinamide-GDP ribazoletransferase [Janthinobacterium sp. K2C7]MBB5383168.1 adenosylcobinamide-GDP ribazoletransferase [Janthinobacterium sp. K2Li3]MBB5388622.1 adenosylcobinamide-GDP ribazoletransferase [Janthinobacterium sp. K2E3]
MANPVSAALHQCRLFFIALQFFTRLPIPRWVGFEPDWLQHASRYFPLVGLVVAAISSAVYLLASWCLPSGVAVLLAVASGIYLTGAFHEDGFADMCDGFGGGYTRERVLDIMKDSRIGAYGAIGIVCLLAIKCVALASLPPAMVVAALLIAHPLSRLAAVSLIWCMDYARDEGKAKPMAQSMSTGEFIIAAICGLLPAIVCGAMGLLAWSALLTAVLVAAGAAWWLGRTCQRRIQGYTGDCLGAVQQVAEVLIYLAILSGFQPTVHLY